MTTNGADWERLAEAFKAARIAAGYPKRATFARAIKIDDSTLQVVEGSRTGRPSDEMLDYVAGRVGWAPGHWRRILAGETVGGDTETAADDVRYRKPQGMSNERWQVMRARIDGYVQAQLDQAATER